MKKRGITLLAAFLFLFSMTACQSQDTPVNSMSTAPSASEEAAESALSETNQNEEEGSEIHDIITSNVHMAWMRTVGGRLKSDYRYSNSVVYNTFPWPLPTNEQKAKIEQTAQAILAARELYSNCSLADLYDEATMPPELRKAHQQNDRAVMEAYGMPIRGTTEASCVAELMRRYQELTR